MQVDTAYAHRCPCCGKPRRIAHLLDLYERNYQLLERLIPELELPFEPFPYQLEGIGIHLFERIEGDYFTILGLPLLPLLDFLRDRRVLAA